MNRVQKLSDSECYAQSSELFWICQCCSLFAERWTRWKTCRGSKLEHLTAWSTFELCEWSVNMYTKAVWSPFCELLFFLFLPYNFYKRKIFYLSSPLRNFVFYFPRSVPCVSQSIFLYYAFTVRKWEVIWAQKLINGRVWIPDTDSH
jgi:hypothetical protein